MQKDRRARRPVREPFLRFCERVSEILVNDDAVARQRNSRRDQIGKAEFARAIMFERIREPGDRARHADAEPAVARFGRHRIAMLVEKHSLRRVGRRRLAIVDGDRLILFARDGRA